MKPRTFGEILDGGFQIFRRHFVVLGLTTLIPSGISAAATLALVGGAAAAGPGAGGTAMMAAFFPVWLLVMCLTLILWGALSWQTSEACTGGPVTLADGLRAGARSFFRLLGAVILSYILLWIGLMVVAFPVGIVAAIAIPALAGGGGGAGAGAVAAILGVALGIAVLVGMTALTGYLAAILPAVVVEGLGPVRAISRSMELARGAVLKSGAVVVVAFIITILPALAVLYVSGQLNPFLGGEPTAPSTTAFFVQQLLGLAVGAFTMPFLAAVITLLYYDRRVRTEAFDVQLAAHQLHQQPAAQ